MKVLLSTLLLLLSATTSHAQTNVCGGSVCDNMKDGPCGCDDCAACGTTPATTPAAAVAGVLSGGPTVNPCRGVMCDNDEDGPCGCDPCPQCFANCPSFPCPYMPPSVPSSIYEIIDVNAVDERPSDVKWSTLKAAIDAAGLGGALSGDGQLTLFAPTDDAFTKAPVTPELLSYLLLPENKGTLGDVLKYHVIALNVPSTSIQPGLVETLNGERIDLQKFATGIRVGDSNVHPDVFDIEATNGVVHAIDRVLIPPNLALPSFTNSPTNKPVAPVTSAPTKLPTAPATTPVEVGDASSDGSNPATLKAFEVKTIAVLYFLGVLMA